MNKTILLVNEMMGCSESSSEPDSREVLKLLGAAYNAFIPVRTLLSNSKFAEATKKFDLEFNKYIGFIISSQPPSRGEEEKPTKKTTKKK